MKKPLIVTILGKPGSGKGTQAKLLQQRFSLEYFGSGDALRKRRKIKDFTAKKLKEVMNKGDLVPSFIISKIWIDVLENLKKQGKFNGFISDGSPRKIIEAQLFDEAIEWYEWEEKFKVILIDISEKESFDRLTKRKICKKCGRLIPWIGKCKNLKECDKCGGELVSRGDDTRHAIKGRLLEFEREVKTVIKHYKNKNKLIKINGEQDIEDVFKEILSKL